MMNSPADSSSDPGPRLWTLLAIVIAGCLVGYLLLRNPTVRESLAELVRHRPRIELAMQRRLLAPRSVLFAGMAGMGVLAVCLVSTRLRAALSAHVPEGRQLVLVFVLGQAAIGVAVVANLHSYFLRAYDQRPLWKIREEEVLARIVAHVRPHALELKQTFPEGARLALRLPLENDGRDAGDRFMLHALAYPVALFDLSPATPNWSDDPQFVETARRYGIQYILDYRQDDRENPIQLEPFLWELSGWRR